MGNSNRIYKCLECNRKVNFGSKFCAGCGSRLEWPKTRNVSRKSKVKKLTVIERRNIIKKRALIVSLVILILSFLTPISPVIMLSEQNRLDKTVEICNGAEDGLGCKAAQFIYNTTFKYFENWVEISSHSFEDYLNGKAKMYTYGVAWSGNSSAPPNDMGYNMSRYSSCRDHYKRGDN